VFNGPAILLTPAAPRRSTPEPADIDDVEALRKELRRLQAEVISLKEEKQDLERRLAAAQREVQDLRVRVPRGPSTS